jgi:DNA-binding NarL/FixJ family response regulator
VTSVFLVEDMQAIRSALAELLCVGGTFEVVGVATTEAEANLWLDEHDDGWGLAIIDLVLAQGTGMGVVAHARRKSVRGRIAVFSDFTTPGVEAHCMRLGANRVFHKGDGPAALVAWCNANCG